MHTLIYRDKITAVNSCGVTNSNKSMRTLTAYGLQIASQLATVNPKGKLFCTRALSCQTISMFTKLLAKTKLSTCFRMLHSESIFRCHCWYGIHIKHCICSSRRNKRSWSGAERCRNVAATQLMDMDGLCVHNNRFDPSSKNTLFSLNSCARSAY